MTIARPLSVCEIFRLGIGPSSSHTVGPMRAAYHFRQTLAECHGTPTRVTVDLMGSLGATGRGHATDRAVVLGLCGYLPESVPSAVVASIMEATAANRCITGPNDGEIPFEAESDIRFVPTVILPYHVNAVTFQAWSGSAVIGQRTYYSVGGGFVVEERGDPMTDPHGFPLDAGPLDTVDSVVPFPYDTGDQFLAVASANGMRISDVVLSNELASRSRSELIASLDTIWQAMQECIDAGCEAEGYLPGGLWVQRRARRLRDELRARGSVNDPMAGMDWVTLYALAVNEENASGHRVVTAPTNGAAGVVPSVLKYFCEFVEPS